MITIESLKSSHGIPDTLTNLCLKDIVKEGDNIDLRKYILPSELGDLIAIAFRDYALSKKISTTGCSNFFKHFKHKYIPLHRIDFSGLPINGNLLLDFLDEYKDQIDEINISKCGGLINIDLQKLNILLKNGKSSHKSLIIGDSFSTEIREKRLMFDNTYHKLFDDDLKLRKLVLHDVKPSVENGRELEDEFTINRQLSGFLTPIMSHTLKYLDLSMCLIGKGSALMHLESLEVLILYDCPMTYPDVISIICQLKKLRMLDISKEPLEMEESTIPAEDPKILTLLVNRLTNLTYLDISGTNLVGGNDRYISAFESRAETPFEFLGLFHTSHDAAYKSCIPAIKIAGDANESQMLNACEAYMDRPEQLSRALQDLYNLYKMITPSETFDDVDRALEVVLSILIKHIKDEQVMIYTTAALWSIVKINMTTMNLDDARVRRTIINRLIDVMYRHIKNRVILINGGLTLLFLPDIICEYPRVAKISLSMCRDPDVRTQSFGTTLLNTLACHIGNDQKIFIGNLDAIETIVDIIRSKVEYNTCDEALETSWSTLWNITDETPANCQRFLNARGLEAFVVCMDKFGVNKEVMKNMMGLLGNVAECKKLRHHFMNEDYIKRFHSLLSTPVDGSECSYNSCGILAHLISSGLEFWNVLLHDKRNENLRDMILKDMKLAIERWPINSTRNINYRSFKPIVGLLDQGIDAEAQYWAVFALTNLTRINPSRYCKMLVPYDGLKKLRILAEPNGSKPFVNHLANIAVYQYERFEREGTLSGLQLCESTDMDVIVNFRVDATDGPQDGTSEMGEVIIF